MYFPFILPTTSYIGLMHGINNIKDKSNNYKNLNNIKYILKNTSCGLAIGIIYPVGIPIFNYYYLKCNFIKNEINHKTNNN
jgi:hypothetical protein